MARVCHSDRAWIGRRERDANHRRHRFAFRASRLPRRHGDRRARAAVVDRLSSRRRHPGDRTARTPSHHSTRQVAAAAGRRRAQPLFDSAQGGLLEVMPHPELRRRIGCSISATRSPSATAKPGNHGASIRGRFENDRLTGRRSNSSSRCRRGAATTAASSPSTRTATCSSRSAIDRCHPKAISRRTRRRISRITTAR